MSVKVDFAVECCMRRRIEEEAFVVYIMASLSRTLYVGMSSDVGSRVWQHKLKVSPKGFTARYNVTRLVYMEQYQSAEQAADREKQIKRWSRAKKIRLIERFNPDWRDLSEDWSDDMA